MEGFSNRNEPGGHRTTPTPAINAPKKDREIPRLRNEKQTSELRLTAQVPSVGTPGPDGSLGWDPESEMASGQRRSKHKSQKSCPVKRDRMALATCRAQGPGGAWRGLGGWEQSFSLEIVVKAMQHWACT